MARKPIHLELKGGKGLRQRVWERIRALRGAEFALRDIVIGSECFETARDYILALHRGGYLSVREAPNRIGRGNQVKLYTLINDAGAEAPRLRRDGTPVTQGLAQEQMWRTLRMAKSDTNARELAAHASTPTVPVAEVAAKSYLKMLDAGGYLQTTRAGHGTGNGGVQARYKLRPDRNTGPKPPMVCRTKCIYDPNEDKVVYQPPVTEEDAIYGR
ncbi:MAG: hypothetical protein C0489_08420 [Candidatus Accumulibacter sp.]|nr:hypothetical protein [Accumulibacter sp.]